MIVMYMPSWDSDKEHDMSDFGDEYKGYYVEKDNFRQVGLIVVKEEFRGKGKYHELLERLKVGMDMVILCSPNEITLYVASKHGFRYNESQHFMYWTREKNGKNRECEVSAVS